MLTALSALALDHHTQQLPRQSSSYTKYVGANERTTKALLLKRSSTMLRYSDVIHPSKRKPALAPDGSINFEGTLSSGQLSFARIAKSIVENQYSLDEQAILELTRLLNGQTPTNQ